MKNTQLFALLVYSLLICLPSLLSAATAQSPSETTKQCMECHEKELQQHYGEAQDPIHWRAGVDCYECHQANPDQFEAFEHHGVTLSINHELNCQRCHKK